MKHQVIHHREDHGLHRRVRVVQDEPRRAALAADEDQVTHARVDAVDVGYAAASTSSPSGQKIEKAF